MYPIEIFVTKTQEKRTIRRKEDLPKDLAFHVLSITPRLDRRDINHRYTDEHPTQKAKHHKSANSSIPSSRNKENFEVEPSVAIGGKNG
jgi:hypothetical protein